MNLRKPYFPYDNIVNIQGKIGEALQSGWLTLGENVNTFEESFAYEVGSKYAVGVSSATAGLHCALLSMGIGKGDEVIVPAKTFISTASAVLYTGATPVFCDVDEGSFNIDTYKIKELITDKTKAIIPVHLAGNMCKMKSIQNFGIPIIEDAAHGHGSELFGQRAGTFGKMGVFSFYPDKIMASCDGGIVVTDDYDMYKKLLLFRNMGREELGSHDYTELGYCYRMNEIQAILAQSQLDILPQMIKTRRAIAELYDDTGIPHQRILGESGYYTYIIKGPEPKGIPHSPMFQTLYKNTIFKKMGLTGNCPISEYLDGRLWTVPLHAGMTRDEIREVIAWMNT